MLLQKIQYITYTTYVHMFTQKKKHPNKSNTENQEIFRRDGFPSCWCYCSRSLHYSIHVWAALFQTPSCQNIEQKC